MVQLIRILKRCNQPVLVLTLCCALSIMQSACATAALKYTCQSLRPILEPCRNFAEFNVRAQHCYQWICLRTAPQFKSR